VLAARRPKKLRFSEQPSKEKKMLDTTNEILNVAAKLEKRCEAARAIAANALPGLDRLYWSKVAQDYADMAGTLRATIVLHHPEPMEAA
jgi:hypothetical protein